MSVLSPTASVAVRLAACASLMVLVWAGGASPAWAQKVVPPGFKVELLYGVPDIEHPSVVTCDDDGNLFIGEDPMDMRGPTKKEFDRVILVRFDKNGGPPKKTVFCENLAAVFGLVWHQGALYVMHAPHYSVFKDTNGDGVADERKDLATGFGPPAGIYGFNDHIVTGTRLGLDGKVYVSVGDKGVPKATGADGSTISLEGGGVIRMNVDGTQLEVVTSGTRNHLDVAMDSLDNIFTYDNTDDGLGWWTRFTHHIESGYYGYPYDYHPHPDRHLPRISEHGGGSPVGAACYREAAWPERFRNMPFHCEWGKGKIQLFTLKKNGASFTSEIEDFMVKEGSEEFRPLDLCFSPDGKHMYVADWNFGGWVNPKVCGRVFKVTYVGTDVPAEPPRATDSDSFDKQLASLGHPAHSERMRAMWKVANAGKAEPLAQLIENKTANKWAKIHAVWALAALGRSLGTDYSDSYLAALKDGDADVRAQAARALGVQRYVEWEDDGKGPPANALTRALADPEATVRLQAAVALGRSRAPAAAWPLFAALTEQDPYVRFAIVQALRASHSWDKAPQFLTSPDKHVRLGALLALTTVYEAPAVKALTGLLYNAQAPADERALAVTALADVHRKADPYTTGWWGTQPAKNKPARPKKHDWESTSAVLAALRDAVSDKMPEVVRLAAIKAYRDVPDEEIVPTLAKIAGDDKASDALRQEAVATITASGSPKAVSQLVEIAAAEGSSQRLVLLAVEALGKLKSKPGLSAVEKRLGDKDAKVRSAAVAAFSQIQGAEGASRIAELLKDNDVEVKKATLTALTDLKSMAALPAIVAAANDNAVRFEAQMAAAATPDKRALALYLDGLSSKNQGLRKASHAALVAIRSQIETDILALHQRSELAPAVRGELAGVFSSPEPIRKWLVVGPWTKDGSDGRKHLPSFDTSKAPDLKQTFPYDNKQLAWKESTTNDPQGKMDCNQVYGGWSSFWGLAYAAIESNAAREASLLIGSDDQATVWVNGKQVFDFQGDRGWAPDQGKATVKLSVGVNHVWVLTGNTGGGWQFSVQMSRQDPRFAFLAENVPAKLDPSQYAAFAAKNKGNPEKGQKIFANEKGVGCIKCHAVAGQGAGGAPGAKVGPDLAGVGLKYQREELIRSVLEPSNRILGEFHMTTVTTANGQVYQGLVKSDTPEGLELIDSELKTIKIAAKDVDEKVKSNLSLMPNGLKDGMSLEEFADVIAYLESLKQATTPPGK